MTPPHSNAAQRVDPHEPERLASWYTPGLSDGIGDRLLMFDNSTASGLELLRFRREFSMAPGFEEALRKRVEELAAFEHPAVAKVRAVEMLSEEDGLALISNHVTGRRLSEILREAHGPQFAAELVRQLVPVLDALQSHGAGIAHGLLTPERIIVTPEGRLVLTEHVLGPAFDVLRLSRDQLKIDLGLVIPPDTTTMRLDDPRGDVVQLGYLALSLLLGQRIRSFDTPQEVLGLVDRQAIAVGGRAPAHLQKWLVRALQVDRTSFASAHDAHRALAEWPDYELSSEAASSRSAPRQIAPANPPRTVAPARPPAAGPTRTEDPFLPEGAETRVAEPAAPLPIEDPWAAPAASAAPVVPATPTAPEAPVVPAEPLAPAASAPVAPAPPPPVAPAAAAAFAPEPVEFTPAPAAQAPGARPRMPGVPMAGRSSTAPALDLSYEAPAPAQLPDHRVAAAPATDPAHGHTPWLRNDARFGPMPSAAAHAAAPTHAPAMRPSVGTRIGPFADIPDEAGEIEVAPEPEVLVAAHKRTHLLQRVVAGLAFVAVLQALIIIGLLATRDSSPEPNAPGPAAAAVAGATPSTAAPAPSAATRPPAAGTAANRPEGRIDVTSDPPGARVTVNGRELGTTPLNVALSPGQHMVIISSGNDTTRRTVNVVAGQTAAIVETFGPAPAANGWVTIETPLDLQVFRGDLLIGTTRADRLMLPPGNHELRLASAALDFEATVPVQVTAGETATVRLPIPNGTVSLNAQPWANVWVNGQALGRTPFTNLSLPIGTHEIIWRHPQLGERRQTIVLTARTPVRLSVDMQQ